MNGTVNPFTTDGLLLGVIAIDTNVGFVTVNTTTELVTPFKVAVMLVLPAPIPVAVPAFHSALLIVATPVLEEFQITEEVISAVVPSV